MLNFGELKAQAAILAQRSGDADYVTKIGSWMSLSHQLLSEIYDYWFDLQDIYNFTTVDGTEAYALPNRFDKPLRLLDLTNKKTIHPQTEEEYTDLNLGNIVDADEGIPDKFRIFGTQGVTTQIASTGKTVQAKSSSASDTGAYTVRVTGYIDSALLIEDSEDITISTSSPTTYVAGSKTFHKITQVSKSADTTGYITLADSDSTVLEYLAPKERVARHKVLKLGLIPASAYSMRLMFKKKANKLSNDGDYPFTECDRYLIMDTLGFALAQDKDKVGAEQAWKEAEKSLKFLLQNQSNKLGPDYQHEVLSKWASAHKNR
jgi:hypothetical protein